jgi:hypothetical protein
MGVGRRNNTCRVSGSSEEVEVRIGLSNQNWSHTRTFCFGYSVE